MRVLSFAEGLQSLERMEKFHALLVECVELGANDPSALQCGLLHLS